MARPFLGLDIGSTSVKIVEIKETSQGVSLVQLNVIPLNIPLGQGSAEERERSVITAIQDFLQTNKVNITDVATCLASESVFIRNLTLTKSRIEKLSKDQIKEIVKTELEGKIPIPLDNTPLDNTFVDFIFGSEVSQLSETKINVTAVVVPHEEINKHISFIQDIGLTPVYIEPAPLALLRIFSTIKEKYAEKTVALIEIGSTGTEVNIIKDNELQLTRRVNLGGYFLTRSIHEINSISFDKAEDTKKRKGLSDEIMPQFERIVDEIRNSFNYYIRQSHTQVDIILLSGGGAKLLQIAKILQEKLEYPVEIIDPVEDIAYVPRLIDASFIEEVSPMLTLGIGLALPRKKKEKIINFLPKELQRAPIYKKKPYLFTSIVSSIILGAFFIYFTIIGALLQGELKKKSNELNKLNPNQVREKVRNIQQQEQEFTRLTTFIKKLTTEKLYHAQILDDVVASLPPSVWMESLAITEEAIVVETKEEKPSTNPSRRQKKKAEQVFNVKRKLNIEGASLKTRGLALFMLRLEKVPYLYDLQLISTHKQEKDNETIMNFSIVCYIEIPGSKEKKK